MKTTLSTLTLTAMIAVLALTSSAAFPAAAQDAVEKAVDAEPIEREYVVLLADENADAKAESDRLLEQVGGGEVTHVYEHGFSGFAVADISAEQAEKIAADSAVEAVEPNFVYSVAAAGSQFPAPAGLDRIDQRLLLPNLFYIFDHMGTGTHAYIVDTGIRTTHAEFGTRARFGVDCTGTGAFDGHGHGTGMAGIVGGTSNGVAKDVQLVAVKVLGSGGSGSLAQVLCGMTWVIFDSAFLGNQPAVANMALQGRPSFILDFVVRISQRFGILYHVAAGNGAQDACNFSPSRGSAPLTVTASNVDTAAIQDVKPAFANFGSCVDLFAPGVGIPTAGAGSDTATQTVTGTSASTAHATGVSAATLEAMPNLTPGGLKTQILSTATTGQIVNPMGTPNLLLYKKQVPSPSITQAPAGQRVYDRVALSGSGFGPFQPGVTRLFFWDLVTAFGAHTHYVWRDGYLEARVPPGNLIAGTPTPITTGPQFLVVVRGNDVSNLVPFQVTTATGTLSYQELTQISGNTDVTTVLGNPNLNLTRTKDGEVGDVDGDGLPDLIDNNSVNIRNQHRSVVRFNNGNKTFTAIELEPRDAADTGTFLTTVPAGGSFVEDSTTYDSDLVDLDNDGLPDLVQALRDHGANPAPCPALAVNQLVRVLMNNNGAPGLFLEASSAWLGSATFPGPVDDIDHFDVDHDGFLDVAVAYRFTPSVDLFLNQGGTSFAPAIRLNLTGGGSAHDVVFLDADGDGFEDIVAVNESGSSELFLNSATTPPTFTSGGTIPFSNALTAVVADFDLDGLDDIALARSTATVFLNNPATPGVFTLANSVSLPNPPSLTYDLEAGDVDLDGSVDLVAVAITTLADGAARVWLNNGTGASFTDATGGAASTLLPGIGPYQRLSADLVDLELDGDLDLYLTGADGQDVGPPTGCFWTPFGRVPNQLWENLLVP